MKLVRKVGVTSEIWQVFIQNTAAFDGSGLTGLTNASSGLTAYYHRDTDTTATAISLVSMTVGTFTSSGFKEVDATNLPGVYQFCPPNAALASGAKSCIFVLKGAANMGALPIEVQLSAVDPDSATAFITGVNSLAPPSNWNLLSVDSNGRVDVIKVAGTAQTARDLGASVLLSSGTGTGQLDFTSGVVKANTTQFGGSAGTFASGRPEVNTSHWAGTATTLTSGLPDVNMKTITAGIIAAASFAANALDAVWSTATRVLTAGTNIVLAKGTGVTGFNDLSAAQVNTEADTALSDVGLTGTVTGRIDAAISSRAATGDIPSAVSIASAVRTNLATELARIDVALSTLSTYDGSDTSGVTTLLARLSDARATLLDNLTNLDAAISAISLSTSERQAIADAYLDRANGIETGLTPREADRLMLAAVLGKASGMDANAPVFRDYNDTKDRVTGVSDEFGNRLSVTYDPS